MKQGFSQNSFRGGMNTDTHPIDQPDNTYRFALNLVTRDMDQESLSSNEYANELCVEFEGDIVGYANIDELDGFVVFVNNNGISEIHYVDQNKCTSEFIASDDEFDCDWGFSDCEFIYGESKSLADCNELYLYWSSGCEYYWVNYSELADEKRKEGLKSHIAEGQLQIDRCGIRSCDYFKVFDKVCAPIINAESKDEGGSLSAGAYYVTVRLKDSEGGITNFFNFTNPVYVGSENNQSGERGSGLVEIDFSELDCDFNSMDIGIVSVVNGIKTAKLVTDVYYVNDDYSYTYTGSEGIDIDLHTLMVNGKTYLQGKDMVAKDGVMWYYNIRQRKNPDLQRDIIDNVEVRVKGYRVPYSQVKKYDLKSLMGGENYALGVVYNSIDQVPTRVFHIPGQQCSSPSGLIRESLSSNIPSPSNSVSKVIEGSRETAFERKNEFVRDDVSNPQLENLDDQIDLIINGCDTDLQSLVDTINNCYCETPDGSFTYTGTDSGSNPVNFSAIIPGEKDCEECLDAGTYLDNDKGEINILAAALQDMLTSLGVDEELAGTFTATNLKEGAQALAASVRDRERISREALREYFVRNTPQYHSPTAQASQSVLPQRTTSQTLFSTSNHDINNNPIGELDIEVVYDELAEGYCEEDILYPLTHNCEGELIYGDLAGTPIRHHKIPDRDEVSLYDAYGGVPSRSDTPESEDEAFVTLLGLEIRNIPIPTEEELGIGLCPKNPYTIVYVKRTESNKSVIAKGIATKTYLSRNGNKEYVFPRHGVNSNETVDRFINNGGDFPRLESNPQPLTDVNFFSLDTLTKKPALNIDTAKLLFEVNGQGERYGLFTEGLTPDNSFYGHRIDNISTRQAVNLYNVNNIGSTEYDINYKIYADPNRVIAPPVGGTRALMNKYRQESIWLGLSDFLPTFSFSYDFNGSPISLINNKDFDLSFTGDGYYHKTSIPHAAAHYMSLKRNKPNQYGSLVNMAYIPLFQSGPQHINGSGFSNIESICGDVYVGATSIVRTGYVSDRIGSCEEDKKYNIGAVVNNAEKRCVCDGPDQAVNQTMGNWVWTEFPEEGDIKDPKNWCNLRSSIEGGPDLPEQAQRKAANGEPPEMDHYYWRTLKTLIIYWGEFEVCPWRRTTTDDVKAQIYPEIKSPYGLDTEVEDITDWKDGLLQQFYYRLEQASAWQKTKKVLIRTTLMAIAPILGIESILNIDSGLDIVAGMIEIPMLAAMWQLMNKTIYPNDKIDKMIGIPICPSDDTLKSSDENIQSFFHNYNKYNIDFSAVNDIKRYFGIPDPYYTCDCDDCDDQGQTVNEYYFSDKQNPETTIDAWKRVRPRNHGRIPANRGQLIRMFESSGAFFAHTTDGLYQLQYKQTALPSDQGTLIMGRGNILADPVPYLAEADEGAFGLNKWTYAINSQYGYFSVDVNARKVYHMINGRPTNITPGMNNFFKEFLYFCEQAQCHDELSNGGTGIALGVDPRNDRFLITKQDGESSWTLSYDIREKIWVSFHSYIPQMYMWDRDHMYTIKDGAIWKHDSSNTFQTYYGKHYPHIIETVETDKDLYSHQFNAMILQTFAHKRNNVLSPKQEDITFDEVLVYNSYQTSGPLKLVPQVNGLREDDMSKLQESTFERDVIREYGQWRVNGFYDMTTDPGQPVMIIPNPCLPFTEPTNFGHNKISEGNYENRTIEDSYNFVRLSYYDWKTKLYSRALLTNINNNNQ